MDYNARNWAKELMSKKVTAQKLIAETYKETLRFMISTFSGLKTIDSENKVNSVPCINASPERAVAKLYQENNIILPLITIWQSNSKDDPKRRRTNDLVIPEAYWDEKHKRALRVITLAPQAININYEINIWTKYSEDMDQIAEQLRLAFAPELKVITKYTNSTAAYITNETNDSNLVVGDRQDRVVRRKFEVAIEGYIPYPKYLVTSTGEITEYNAEYGIVTDSAIDLDSSSIPASAVETEIGTFTEK